MKPFSLPKIIIMKKSFKCKTLGRLLISFTCGYIQLIELVYVFYLDLPIFFSIKYMNYICHH